MHFFKEDQILIYRLWWRKSHLAEQKRGSFVMLQWELDNLTSN